MKRLLFLTLFLITLFILQSCGNKGVQTTENKLNIEKIIEFNEGVNPDYFTVTTIKGKQINSKDYLGKNLVLHIGDAGFEGKMSEGFNELFNKYKNNNKVAFLTIIDGDEDDNLQEFLSKYNTEADFIDNRRKAGKKQLRHNVGCHPATFLINNKGKVIYAGCGGYGFADEYLYKLDSLIF